MKSRVVVAAAVLAAVSAWADFVGSPQFINGGFEQPLSTGISIVYTGALVMLLGAAWRQWRGP